MGFSFVHAADLHLGSIFSGIRQLPAQLQNRALDSSLVSFKKMIDFCLEQQVDFLVLAGDVFQDQTPSLRVQQFFVEQIKRLVKSDVEVFMVSGNHDATAIENLVFTLPNNFYLFPTDQPYHYKRTYNQSKVNIHGISYSQAEIKENLFREFPSPNRGSFNLGILHCEVGGNQQSRYAPVSSGELDNSGYDYWALGHIHTTRSNPLNNWHYPGILQGRHWLEDDHKGFLFVEYSNEIITTHFKAVQDILWLNVSLDVSKLQLSTFTDTLLELKEEIRSSDSVGIMVQIALTGSTDLNHWLEDKAKIEEMLDLLQTNEEHLDNFVWVNDIHNQTSSSLDFEELIEQGDFLAEVLQYIDKLAVDNIKVLEELWDPMVQATGLSFIPEDVLAQVKINATMLLRGGFK